MPGLEEAFERIGARARVRHTRTLALDVRTVRRREEFDLGIPPEVEAVPLNVRPRDRALLLLVRDGDDARYLFGHDERHWFVAALPGDARVTTVAQAREALKPPEVRAAEHRRRARECPRQGEWFFVPAPHLEVDQWVVLREEPLSRGPRSTPHLAEEAVRLGGETVYLLRWIPVRARIVTSLDPRAGLTEAQREDFLREYPQARSWPWEVRRVNPEVFVRGRIRHPDHATLVLRGWHRVFPNTEPSTAGARPAPLVFLD